MIAAVVTFAFFMGFGLGMIHGYFRVDRIWRKRLEELDEE